MIDLPGVNVILNVVHCDCCFDKFYFLAGKQETVF